MSIEQEWLALQYVLDELSGAERDTFEVRLANEPALCQAVADASRLVLTAGHLPSETPADSEAPVFAETAGASDSRTGVSKISACRNGIAVSPSSVRSSWVAVGGTVCVALLALFALQVPLSSHRSTDLAERHPAAAELVSLWHSGVPDDLEAEDPDGDLADGVGDVSVPDWMLAAVSLQLRDDPNGPVQEN